MARSPDVRWSWRALEPAAPGVAAARIAAARIMADGTASAARGTRLVVAVIAFAPPAALAFAAAVAIEAAVLVGASVQSLAAAAGLPDQTAVGAPLRLAAKHHP